MKTFNIILTTLVLSSGCCTSTVTMESARNNVIKVSGCGFKGIILTADYVMPFPSPNSKGSLRFTPQEGDIVKAERIIRGEIKELNKDRFNQQDGSPIIDENLSNYFRQYVGYINEKGEHVLYVNMLWNNIPLIQRIIGRSDPQGYEDGFVFVCDGGSEFWNVSIDLDTQEVIQFSVNGVA